MRLTATSLLSYISASSPPLYRKLGSCSKRSSIGVNCDTSGRWTSGARPEIKMDAKDFRVQEAIHGVFTAVGAGGETQISSFYEEDYEYKYSCSIQFEKPKFFDCACVTGLWILYNSCQENVTITGDDTPRCTRLSGAPMSRAVQVVKNREELATVASTGDVTLLNQETIGITTIVYNDWGFITGSDWTLIEATGTRICLSVIDPDAYCYFSHKEDALEILGVEKGCERFDYFLDPQKCVPIVADDGHTCDYHFTPNVNVHKLVKREDAAAAPAPPAAGGNSSSDANSTAITEEDEDYEISLAQANSTSGGNGTEDPSAIIADGILEFMDGILDDLLGFRDNPFFTGESTTAAPPVGLTTAAPGRRVKKSVGASDTQVIEEVTNSSNLNPLNVTYFNPAYEFLEISKRITQKTCPSFYVKPEFLNLAVATFIRLQQVEFKFPETSFKPAGFRRVLEYLRKCEQFASQFNFTDADCDGKVDGNYTAYGQTIELTVTAEYANFDRDPIIESVWKVFFNAHSYCYPFFNKTLDHHRFTTWMIPLFQNQINDIWTAGKTTEKSLNGLFGNQIQVQANLAYCAVSSRLESSYPFDLPRPARVPEYGPSLTGGAGGGNSSSAGAPAPPAGRRKRDINYLEWLSAAQSNSESCLEQSSTPLLCPDHVKTIVT